MGALLSILVINCVLLTPVNQEKLQMEVPLMSVMFVLTALVMLTTTREIMSFREPVQASSEDLPLFLLLPSAWLEVVHTHSPTLRKEI